jgi:hypothetical protein
VVLCVRGSPITIEKLAWEAVTRCIVPPSGFCGNRNFNYYSGKSRVEFSRHRYFLPFPENFSSLA